MSTLATSAYVVFFSACVVMTALSLMSLFRPRAIAYGDRMVPLVAFVGVAGLVGRTFEARHLPLFGTFENSWTCAVAISLFVLVAPRLLHGLGDMWRWMMPWAVAILTYGLQFRSQPVALTISEQSILVDVHVALAWTAFASLLCAVTMSFISLIGRRDGRRDADEWQRTHDHLVLGGYVALSAMLVVGSFYLWILFASPWRWEIVGTLTLLAWLGLGILIHGRLFYRWSGRGYHAGMLAVLPVLLLAFWVWSVFPGTYHFFDIPLVKPY